jgi:Protein of unknown function (DUF2889)
MPLPPSVPRDELHQRRIDLRGYHRHDGLYDVKARELTLPHGRLVPPGEPIHDMWIRLVVDEDLNVIDIVASTDASPFGICREATATLQSMKGVRIGAGWSLAVRQHLAGRQGCTHLTELLAPLATVAFQTLSQVRQAKPTPVDADGKPRKIDSCYAYASDREVVQRLWPMYHAGGVEAPASKEREGTSAKGTKA